jgi:signal transduction histidine kinase
MCLSSNSEIIDDEIHNYFQIRLKRFFMENKEKILVQFIDISKSILYDNQKLQNQALEMINACVSHEMRNPLNSIVAQNIEKKYLYIDLKNDLAQLKEEVKNNLKASLLVTNCELTLIKLNNGIKVQESSSFCLQFMIQDMLDFS